MGHVVRIADRHHHHRPPRREELLDQRLLRTAGRDVVRPHHHRVRCPSRLDGPGDGGGGGRRARRQGGRREAQFGEGGGEYAGRRSGRAGRGGRVGAHDQEPGAGAPGQGEQLPLVDQQRRRPLGDTVGGREVGPGADVPVDPALADVRLLEQPQLRLQPKHPQDRLVESRLGQLAVLDGLEDRVPRDVEVRRVEELVHARLEREDGDTVVAVLRPYALHAERVGHHQPVVAELLAQDAGEDRAGEGGRVAGGVERRDHDVGGHDRVDAGPDGGPEGRRVQGLPLLTGVGDDREAVVAVDGGVAVPGEVLGGGRYLPVVA